MQTYELMYIMRGDLTDEKLDQLQAKINSALVDNGAKIITEDRVGKRDLGTPFKKSRTGIYVRIEYQADKKALDETQRLLRITDGIIRFMNVRIESVRDKSHVQQAAA